MPFQISPGRDDGYDVSDYYGVNPAFGTLGDFVEFTHAAAQRGIRVIIDLVVNHTSNEHNWFQEAPANVRGPLRLRLAGTRRKGFAVSDARSRSEKTDLARFTAVAAHRFGPRSKIRMRQR